MKSKKYINFILGIITTCALFFNYNLIANKGLKGLNKIMETTPIILAIVSIAIIIFYCKFNKKEYKTNWLQKIVCLFFACIMLLGKSFEQTNSWDLIFKNKLILIVSIIGLIGYFILFRVIFQFLNFAIFQIKLEKIDFKKNYKFIQLFEKKTFLSSLLTILIFWAIYLIAFYPGILNPDSAYQILQDFNIHTKYSDWVIQLDPNVNITNHHPVLHTLLLGTCVKIGRAILNDNFGIFIVTFIQMIILASTLAYTIQYLKKINISSKIRFIILGIYCLVPMFAFYAITNVKDTIYTALIILYIIQLYDYIKFYKNKKMSYKKLFIFLLLMLLISLFRNNGIYVVILSFIFAIFYTKINVKKMTVIFLIYILLYKSYTGLLLPYFKISNTSIREALSIPFQQTARYVKYHESDLTAEDKEIIDKVLNYDTLAQKYKPTIADPVKNQYNKYATQEDLKEYFKVWLKGLYIHPDCYVQAFINNTYGYFYPTNKKWYIYYNKNNVLNKQGNINYHYNSLEDIRKGLIIYGKGFRSIPLIGLLSNIGFNTCLIIVYSVYLIMQKQKRRYFIILLPHLVTILVCLMSPVNSYFRYAMPYIFAMPITTIFFMKEMLNKGEEENEEK